MVLQAVTAGLCRSAANNEEVFVTNPRRHVKDKYPFGNSTSNFPPRCRSSYVGLSCSWQARPNGLSLHLQGMLLLAERWRPTLLGVFLRDFLVAGPLAPLHLDLPFLIASLIVYLP
jgi:hypothetical protein